MITYTQIENEFGRKYIEQISSDGVISFIPIDPANSDYQRYLRWLENPDADESGTL